jgi:hypothetical protein
MNSRFSILVAAVVTTALLACSARQPAAPAEAAAPESADSGKESALTLTAEQRESLGIESQPAAATQYASETEGFGVVMAHDAIAQATAEVAAAAAASRQSSAALARIQGLSSTAGAFPAENLETAQRQSASDTAALQLAQRKLSSVLGNRATITSDASLGELASGQTKLVRVTFPLGSGVDSTPKTIRLMALGAATTQKSLRSAAIWNAPADASVPGRSFFAVLRGGDVSEGERLRAFAPTGAAQAGILVPADAVVINDNSYWCFIEKPAGTFKRVEIDPSRPVSGGYVVTEGITSGDPIVVKAAGHLLAREVNPATEAE